MTQDRTIRTIKGPIELVAWGPDPTGFNEFEVKERAVGQPVEDAAAKAVQEGKQDPTFVPAGTTPDGDTQFVQADVNPPAPVPASTAQHLNDLREAVQRERDANGPAPIDDPYGLQRVQAPMQPTGVNVMALLHAQHLYIRAQQAYTKTKELHLLAAAQDDYIEALTTALEEAGVL